MLQFQHLQKTNCGKYFQVYLHYEINQIKVQIHLPVFIFLLLIVYLKVIDLYLHYKRLMKIVKKLVTIEVCPTNFSLLKWYEYVFSNYMQILLYLCLSRMFKNSVSMYLQYLLLPPSTFLSII